MKLADSLNQRKAFECTNVSTFTLEIVNLSAAFRPIFITGGDRVIE